MNNNFIEIVKNNASVFLDKKYFCEIEKKLNELGKEEILNLMNLKNYVDYFKKSKDRLEELIFCLYYLDKVMKKYEENNISLDIFYDTFKDIQLWTEFYYNEHKKVGINEIVWLSRLFELKIFRFFNFEFELSYLTTGNVFNLDEGEVVNIHIPRGANISVNKVKESLCAFRKFVKNYAPKYVNAKIICDSWLLWDGLKVFLKEDSKIITFQNLFNLTYKEKSNDIIKFVFNKNDMLFPIPKENVKSSLQKSLYDYSLKNGEFYVGFGVLKEL